MTKDRELLDFLVVERDLEPFHTPTTANTWDKGDKVLTWTQT